MNVNTSYPLEILIQQKVEEITKGPVTFVHVSKVYELLDLIQPLLKEVQHESTNGCYRKETE